MARISTDLINRIFGNLPTEGKLVRTTEGQVFRATGTPNILGSGRLALAPTTAPEGAAITDIPFGTQDINLFGSVLAPGPPSPEDRPRFFGTQLITAEQARQIPTGTPIPTEGELLTFGARDAIRTGAQREADQIALFPDERVDERDSARLRRDFQQLFAGRQAPAQPSLVEEFQAFRQQVGLPGVEGELETARADLRALEDEVVSREREIKGQPGVTSRFIGRRLVQLDKETADAFDTAQTQVRDLQDRVDGRNKTVSMFMNLAKQDFTNARRQYEFEFNKAIQLYNSLSIEENRAVDNARANLQLMMNQMSKSKISYNDLDTDGKLAFDSEAVRSGLSSELGQFIQANTEGEIAWHSKNPDGTHTVFYKDVNNKITGYEIVGEPTGPRFFDSGGNEMSPFDAARSIIEANPEASENELVIAIRESVVDDEGKSLISTGDAQRIARTSIADRPPPTVEEIKQKIIDTLERQKDVFSRSEAKTTAENQLKVALKLKKGQVLPDAFKDAIEDALVVVYGRTFFQKIFPGGR